MENMSDLLTKLEEMQSEIQAKYDEIQDSKKNFEMPFQWHNASRELNTLSFTMSDLRKMIERVEKHQKRLPVMD